VDDTIGKAAATSGPARDEQPGLHKVLDNLFVLVALFAPDGRLLEASRAAFEVTAKRPEDILGKLFWELEIFSRSEARVRDIFLRAAAGGTVRQDLTLQLPDGSQLTVDTTFTPLFDDAGRVVQVMGSGVDVTDRKRAEHELRASEARYRALVDHAPVNVYVHDGKTILFANAAMAKLLGARSPDEVVGRPLMSIVHPGDHAVLQQRAMDLLSRGEVNPVFRGRVVRFDGEAVDVDVIATKCLFEGAPAIQVVLLDVTESIKAEAERQRLEGQLRQAQRMDAIGTLAAGVAHDFNNLLGIIAGNATLAEQDVGPAHPATQRLHEIGRAAGRAADLVRQILTFGRPQQQVGRVVSLQAIIEEVSRLLRATIPAGVELETRLDPVAPKVLAEPTQIHQVLVNLCTNAWHAMDGNAGRIEVRLTAAELDETTDAPHAGLPPGRYARVTVSDTGQGMDAQTLERIFEPFFTTKPVGQGTGLGLSVVHGIMKSHGGVIIAASRPGVGSTFELYFPAADAPSARPIARAASTDPARPARPLHVLFVDDEPAIVMIAKQALEHEGHRVAGYTRADDALDALRTQPERFDVLITDYNMPGRSGVDIVAAARRLDPTLPAAVASGFVSDDLRRRAAEAGVTRLLNKPYTLPELCDLVRELAVDDDLRGQPKPPRSQGK
jgi:PAS domain S-box-containing protein